MGKGSHGLRSQDRTLYAGCLQYQRKPLRVFWVLFAAGLAMIMVMIAIIHKAENPHLAWEQQAKQEWQITTRIVCEQGLIWELEE
jgi:hypothetical protein